MTLVITAFFMITALSVAAIYLLEKEKDAELKARSRAAGFRFID